MSENIRLIYISEVDGESFSSDMLEDILFKSHRNNPDLDITGMLVCTFGHFLQALEGPEEAVETLYQKIAKDSRHRNFKMLKEESIDNRLFGDWAMGFRKLDEDTDLSKLYDDSAADIDVLGMLVEASQNKM